MLTRELVDSLRLELINSCPVDSGALKLSIQPAQLTAGGWVITIGNDDDAINGTPTNRYASITNNNKSLFFKNKNGEVIARDNKNYHWVNKAIARWCRANQQQLIISLEEENTDE